MPYLLTSDIGELIGDIGSKLFPNLESVIVQLCATAVMFFIVLKFFYKPIKANIEKRKDFIKNNVDEAEKNKNESKELYEKTQFQLKDAHVEARKIKEEAEIQARYDRETIIAKTNQEIIAKKLKLSSELEQEKENARKEIHDEIVNVAIKAASKIVEKEVDNTDNRKLVNDFIKEIQDER